MNASTADHGSILAQKVRGATISVDGFPELTAMAAYAAKNAGLTVSELLEVPTQSALASVRIHQLKDALHKAPNFGSYSWLIDTTGKKGALITVHPTFVAMLTERLLGGKLPPPDPERKITRIDVELSYKLVDAFIPAVNRTILRYAGPTDDLVLSRRFSAPAPDEVVGDVEAMTTFDVLIDLLIDEYSVEKAVRLTFPVDFVERAGLLNPRTKAVTASEASPWRRKVGRNIRLLDVELKATLDRFTRTVGELSRLKVGQFIPVDEERLEKLELVVTTADGPAAIASGKLGALKENKAIKLTSPVDPSFVPPF
ncbi:MAG: FliM/FliN family flagellar motor switch protein [Pseudomonadota bacterium]